MPKLLPASLGRPDEGARGQIQQIRDPLLVRWRTALVCGVPAPTLSERVMMSELAGMVNVAPSGIGTDPIYMDPSEEQMSIPELSLPMVIFELATNVANVLG